MHAERTKKKIKEEKEVEGRSWSNYLARFLYLLNQNGVFFFIKQNILRNRNSKQTFSEEGICIKITLN